jgi:hypothetical protein
MNIGCLIKGIVKVMSIQEPRIGETWRPDASFQREVVTGMGSIPSTGTLIING